MKYPLYDAHAHLGTIEEEKIRIEQGIYTLMNASTREEYEKIKELSTRYKNIVMSVGIHPWRANKLTVEEMLPFMKESRVIGEIGMDSVWCDVDLSIQEKIFIEQMNVAEKLRKPVILHTKGQEDVISQLIKPYTIPILIHWYSDENYLEAYIDKDCFFTIGPDFKLSKAVRQVAERVPLNRLLIETDGIGAVEWALDRKIQPEELPKLLRGAMEWLAEIKGITIEEVEEQIKINWEYLMND